MDPVIEVRDLVKQYPGVRAVDGVSFAIAPGTCFGLLGPNGAGKTTTVEMMEGITPPTAGTILYRGEPLGARFRAEAGIQFQRTALQEFITVRETLAMFRRLYAEGRDIDELVSLCALEQVADRDNRKLSGGQLQRLLLAVALVNDPQLLFLDEPTTGLDPQARRNFWRLVKDIKAQRKTVLLTTHYMEEAYVLCDEIAIMDRGRIIARGTPDRLLKEHFDEVIVELPRADLPAGLDGLPANALLTAERVEIPTADVDATLKRLIELGVPLRHLNVRPRNLEDLFLELTGRELRA